VLLAANHLVGAEGVQARRRRRAPRSGGRTPSSGTALLQFAVTGIAALVLLALVGSTVLRSAGTHEAIRQAQEIATVQTRSVVQPAVSDRLVDGNPVAFAEFDRLMRDRVLGLRVVRAKLWTEQGRIVYADDSRLVGRSFALSADDRRVLQTGRPNADLSDLNAPENKFERSAGQLLQVYERVTTQSGRPLLFEIYLHFDSVLASGNRIWKSFLPAFLVGLLVLELLQIPLARRLTRRIERDGRERSRLHRKVLAASEDERRRIARDLHDGVVQTLAGVTYSLTALGDELRVVADEAAVDRVRQAAATTRLGVSELRTLMVEIYPPNLRPAGRRDALDTLLGPLRTQGINAQLTTPEHLPVAPETATVLYRVAQEALRNVAAHSGASHVRVQVSLNGRARLDVIDDGRGFVPEAVPDDNDRPHFGLRLLHELALEVGGRLTVDSRPGGGTAVRLEMPRT
jgi:signal transduction histidine kinase